MLVTVRLKRTITETTTLEVHVPDLPASEQAHYLDQLEELLDFAGARALMRAQEAELTAGNEWELDSEEWEITDAY